MNDAFGDPRNYDPNDTEFNPYEFDDTWGDAPQTPVEQPPPNWTDPDNPPPPPGHGWLYDPSSPPQQNPGPGNYWNWNGSQWEPRPLPHAPAPQAPTGAAGAPAGVGGGGGANPFEYGGGGEDWDPGSYRWSSFNPSPYGGYQEFQTNPFVAPDPEQTANDPWLQFALKQGTQQLENSAAYQGMVRSGMNKKNVLEHGVNFTRQFGNDVWNRAMTGWRANEDNRFRAWDGNKGLSLDTYDRNYRGQHDSFLGQQASEQMDFNARLQQWRDRLNATTQVATAGL